MDIWDQTVDRQSVGLAGHDVDNYQVERIIAPMLLTERVCVCASNKCARLRIQAAGQRLFRFVSAGHAYKVILGPCDWVAGLLLSNWDSRQQAKWLTGTLVV